MSDIEEEVLSIGDGIEGASTSNPDMLNTTLSPIQSSIDKIERKQANTGAVCVYVQLNHCSALCGASNSLHAQALTSFPV